MFSTRVVWIDPRISPPVSLVSFPTDLFYLLITNAHEKHTEQCCGWRIGASSGCLNNEDISS